MKNFDYAMRISLTAWLVALSYLVSPVAMASDSEWEYTAYAYLFAPNLSVTTPGGNASTLPFYQILDNLEMGFMGGTRARKDRLSFSADLIYLDLDRKAKENYNYEGTPLDIRGDVSLKGWIITPTVGYAVHDSRQSRVEIIGGFRYLWLKASAQVDFDDITVFDESESGSWWDAVVGARATFDLNDKWYMPFYVDIGTGQTDSTWQGFAGIGYRFEKVNAVLGYRYLHYEFDNDNSVIGEMTAKGPLLGFTVNF